MPDLQTIVPEHGTRTGAALARLHTPAALLAAAVLLIDVPVDIPVGGTVFGPGDVASALLVLAVGVVAIRRGTTLSRSSAVLFGSVVLATSIVAVAGADTSSSVPGLIRYLQLFALVPLAVVLAIRSDADALLTAHAMIAGAGVQGVVSIVQVLSGNGASYQGASVRAVGTFGATDVIAMSVVVGLAVTLSIGLALSASGRRRVTYLGLAAFLVIPLGLSLSRGSWISTIVAVVIVVAFAGGRVLIASIVSVVALAIVLVLGFGIGSALIGDRIESIFDSPDSSINDRDDLRVTALGMWEDHPLTGVGLKSFPHYRDKYAPADLNTTSDVGGAGTEFMHQELLSPHNQYLLVLSEQGLVGIAPFLALMLLSAGSALRATLRGSVPARGLGAGIVGLTAWQLFQFYYGDVGGMTSLLTSVILGMALWWGLDRRPGATA